MVHTLHLVPVVWIAEANIALAFLALKIAKVAIPKSFFFAFFAAKMSDFSVLSIRVRVQESVQFFITELDILASITFQRDRHRVWYEPPV
jgi:hypothetical protein